MILIILHFVIFYYEGLRIIVKGRATCSWRESGHYTSHRHRTTIWLRGQEEIIRSEFFLFGSKDGKAFDIPSGVYNYKFSQHLPPQIPYSVKSDYGEISYKIIATLVTDWAKDLTAKKPFTVLRYEDLNLFPELRMPLEVEKIKTFCCFPCGSKPLIINLMIPRRGFALGEEIPVEVQLVNRSSTPVKETILVLKRLERYISKSPHNSIKKIDINIAKVTSRGAKAGEITSFLMNLEVPRSALKSNDKYCEIFQITYELKFKALINGFHFSPSFRVPITIGSVKIR